MKEWHESIGAAIESAAGGLPKGWTVKIEIEHGGWSVELYHKSHGHRLISGESLVDDIEQATADAISFEANNA